MREVAYKDLQIQDSASITKKITEHDVALFAIVSGDENPIHIDQDYAVLKGFKRCIVHGALLTSLFSQLLGTELPGLGTIYVSQEVKFLRPVFVDDEVTAKVTVIEKDDARNFVTFLTTVTNDAGKVAVTGHGVVRKD